MQPDVNPNPRHSWWKDILIGFLAWLLAFVLFMLPAFGVAIAMGFDLGPRLNDNAEVSRRISLTIREIYQSGWYLHVGFIVMLAILVYWRASVRTRQVPEKSSLHGAIIGAVAAIMVTLQMISLGVGIYEVAGVVVSVVAGLTGGRSREVPRIAA